MRYAIYAALIASALIIGYFFPLPVVPVAL